LKPIHPNQSIAAEQKIEQVDHSGRGQRLTAEVDEGDIVRSEVDELTLTTPAKNPREGKATDTASDFDRTSA
jgi:hypothetical protein